MCGIAGFVLGSTERDQQKVELQGMLSAISHRGPDDQGEWFDRCIALGHRRLSILDLSPAGHQPMDSVSQRYVIAFNGEIYNHDALRNQLATMGYGFRGHSDTEVLLALVEQHGLEEALRRCVGMFAIALWDRKERVLQLARDRFGEKPLYYGWHGGAFVFGSELKALKAHPSFRPEIDPEAVSLLLRYGYIPAPYCIYLNTRKVCAGEILTLSLADASRSVEDVFRWERVHRYWSSAAVLENGVRNGFKGSFTDASRELEVLLSQAVKGQMQADVPLGAFLSGGVDSSMVVALMQAQSLHSVKTFAIGFDDNRFNEAQHAKVVAAHLGTDHHELYLSHQDALDVIPLLPEIYDEPLADSSQIPVYCLARMTRSKVTVSLSGDGGDEIFGGYRKYQLGSKLASLPCRRALAGLLGFAPLALMESVERKFSAGRMLSPRVSTLRHWLSAPDFQDLAGRLSELNREAGSLMIKESSPKIVRQHAPGAGFLRTAMLEDSESYLPDDVLAKVDRATMAVSLESRAPLLDHRIAEFVASLPEDWLVDAKGGKRILRDVLYRHVPAALVDRPKQGFSIPLATWLRGELLEWAGDLLEGNSRGDLLQMERVREVFADHRAGRRDCSAQLWPILSLLAWSQQQKINL